MIFADTNVLLDLSAPSPFADWCERTLGRISGQPFVTNLVVFAELSSGFETAEAVSGFLGKLGFGLKPLTADVAFLAGRAHRAYRRAGGMRQTILPDFLIGAHASALGAALLTRDRGRFTSYFPDLPLITPETHPNG